MHFARHRRFTLPEFELAPLEFDSPAEMEEELLLDEVVATINSAPPVARPDKPVPTAGELRASIERHLCSAKPCEPPIDAAEELRNALVELRQSLG